MNSTDKMFVWIVGIIMTALLSVFISGMLFWNQRVRFYTENGYTRTTLTGENGIHWVKDEKTPR